MSDMDTLIIGGGISGLSAAWWCRRAGRSVALWESDDRLGGKIETNREGGYVTEAAACMTAHAGPALEQFLTESAAGDARVSSVPAKRRYMVKEGQLLSQPAGMASYAFSPVLDMRSRLRAAMEPFVGRRSTEHESVTEFVTRRLGSSVLENVVGPMVSGSLASDPDLADIDAVLPGMGALEAKYGSLGLGFVMQKLKRMGPPPGAFSFEGGMSGLIARMVGEIGDHIQIGMKATAIERRYDGWTVFGLREGREVSVFARNIILAVPASKAASLLKEIDRELSALLAGIDYAPLNVVHLGFDCAAIDHPLNGTGFVVPRGEGQAMTGCLWMSSLFPDHAPEGKSLLTAYLGGALRPEAVQWDDARAVDSVFQTLVDKMKIVGAPEMARIDRHDRALPLYHGNYMGRLAMMDERLRYLPGLQLEANYRGGVSVRERISRGRLVTDRLRPCDTAKESLDSKTVMTEAELATAAG